MAFFRGDIRSNELGMDTAISVILPDDCSEIDTTNCKVLFLLHGNSDNASTWFRNSRIEFYAKQYRIAVIMPEVQRSYYTDMVHGLNYFTYIADELPIICRKLFHFSDKREDTMIAGLSMGGYGALKCAFSRPDLFSKCGAFSPGIDRKKRFLREGEEWRRVFSGIFDGKLLPKDDLYYLAESLGAKKDVEKPEFFVTCGLSDYLYDENIQFKEYMKPLPFKYSYVEWEGTHEWGFWDESLRLMLEHYLGG